MTKFTKETLSYHGGYLHYQPNADSYYEGRKFVARFKHRGPVTKTMFVKTLMKHYTVEQYFARLEGTTGVRGEAPLEIFRNDGLLVFRQNEKTGGYFVLDGKVI